MFSLRPSYYFTLVQSEAPGRTQHDYLEHALQSACDILDSQEQAMPISLLIGERVIYNRQELLALMNHITQVTKSGITLVNELGRIAQERTIDRATFQSICDEVSQGVSIPVTRSDLSLDEKRNFSIGELLKYARLYLGNNKPGGCVPPAGGSNFYSRLNAVLDLVTNRSKPHFDALPQVKEFMERLFGDQAWVDEESTSPSHRNATLANFNFVEW